MLLSYLNLALERHDWSEVGRVKSELDLMSRADAMGFVVRSRFKQNAEEERASLYHAVKEVKNSSHNINSLKIGGRIVKDPRVIEDEVVNFFGALLNGQHDSNLVDTGVPFVPDNSFLADFLQGLSSLDNDQSAKLHEDVDVEEVDTIIKECENNKAPGLDGLS